MEVKVHAPPRGRGQPSSPLAACWGGDGCTLPGSLSPSPQLPATSALTALPWALLVCLRSVLQELGPLASILLYAGVLAAASFTTVP